MRVWVRLSCVLFIAATAAGGLSAAASSAGPVAKIRFFRTPTGSIGCAYLAQFRQLRCDTRFATRFSRHKHTCREGDYGQSFTMTSRGRAVPRCASDTVLDRSAPVLRYGRTRHFGSIACTSRLSGLTCRNARGHGWILSRRTQRIL